MEKPPSTSAMTADFTALASLTAPQTAISRLHLLITYDHIIPAGKSYGELDPEAPWGADIVEQACGDPTIRDVAYDSLYGWVDVWERLPRPYYTFDNAKGYTAEGKPACYKIGLYK